MSAYVKSAKKPLKSSNDIFSLDLSSILNDDDDDDEVSKKLGGKRKSCCYNPSRAEDRRDILRRSSSMLSQSLNATSFRKQLLSSLPSQITQTHMNINAYE